MATATVTNTVKDGSGAAINDLVVIVQPYPLTTQCFSIDGHEVLGPFTAYGDATGAWSLALERTDTMTPTGMVYQVIERSTQRGVTQVSYITVPGGGGALEDLLASQPAAPAPGTGPVGPRGATGPAGLVLTVTATKTAAYNANSSELVPGDASAGDFSVTLPAPTNGATVVVKNVATPGTVTVLPHVAETIDGAATYPLRWGYRQQAQEFVADGTNWRTVIAQPQQEHIVFPFAFDTAGLAPQHFAITAVVQLAQTFTIAGDHTALFPDASTLVVAGSTGNDGTYTLNGAAAFTGGNTVITVNEVVPNAVADGTLVDTTTAGVVVSGWTPAVDDLVVYGIHSVTGAFDGPAALADIGLDADTDSRGPGTGWWGQYTGNGANLRNTDGSAGPSTETNSGARLFPPASEHVFLRLVLAGSLRLWASQDGTPSGADPGSTRGAATLHLLVLPA